MALQEGLRLMEKRARYPEVQEGRLVSSINNQRGVDLVGTVTNSPRTDGRDGITYTETYMEVAAAGNIQRIAKALFRDVNRVYQAPTEDNQPVRFTSFERTGERSFNTYDIVLTRPGNKGGAR